MEQLTCIGADGKERIFYFDITHGSERVSVIVHRRNPPHLNVDDCFEFSLERITDGRYKVTMMNHHGKPWYSKMGIPDALIPRVAEELKCSIVSSNNQQLSSGEYQTTSARKVWERLVQTERATYDSDEGRFLLMR